MQFVRYLPLAAQRYGTLILICPAALRPPLAMLQDVAQIREAGTITAAEFDICLPLLSLPRVFGTTLVTIPAAVPYLDVAAIRRQDPTALPQLVGSAVPKVGLVWVDRPTHPHDRQRSCALWGWVRVLQTPGIAWSSLQTGDQRQELAQLPPDILIQDLAPFLHDFGDKALLLDQLDLVITVDTEVAHMAGAIDKSV